MFSDPTRSVKMPLIRIFPSKNRRIDDKTMQESSTCDLQLVTFPDISEVF